MPRSAVSIAAILSIAIPGQAPAQIALEPDSTLLVCPGITPPPCADGSLPVPLRIEMLDGRTAEELEEAAIRFGGSVENLLSAAATGTAISPAPTAEAPPADAPADAPVAAAPAAPAEAPAPQAAPAPETAEAPPAEAAPEVEALGDALEADAGAPPDAPADADVSVAGQGDISAETSANSETPPEAPLAEAPPADAPAPEAAPAAEAPAEAPAPEIAEAPAPIDAVPQEDTAVTVETANETPEVAATSEAMDGEAPPGAVETVTVTAESARSSNQEFAAEEEGLSDFEKLFLGGLGALAIGQILASGDRVVQSTGDRVVVERGGELRVLKDDDAVLRQPGSEVSTRTFEDGSTLTRVLNPNGVEVVTVRAADGRVLRRTRILPDGREFTLFDDTRSVEALDTAEIRDLSGRDAAGVSDLGDALERDYQIDRRYSLQQIRQVRAVRDLMPSIDLAAINFETGSAAIRRSEAAELRDIGRSMAALIELNPEEVFLVEGHTDAVGSATSNLALSDRRAESVALALTEYFAVPPENMIVQGYGESDLAVPTLGPSFENRRATVRRITPLLRGAGLN